MSNDSPPPPARFAIASITAERVDIYQRVPPLGRSIPVSLDPFPVNESVPKEEVVARSVRNLRLNRSGGPSVMQAEHLQYWQRDTMRDELLDPSKWVTVVRLIQPAFCEGRLAEECA